MDTPGLICLGRIARPHGIRGECVADVQLEDPGVLRKGCELYLLPPDKWPGAAGCPAPGVKPHTLLAVREHKGRLLISLQDVADRDAAEALRGRLICVPEEALPPPADDEIYCYQLVGCKVFLPDGAELGEIVEVAAPTEEQEIWTIVTAQGKEALFPAHPETVVNIDIQARHVHIAPPEGLLEIYLGE